MYVKRRLRFNRRKYRFAKRSVARKRRLPMRVGRMAKRRRIYVPRPVSGTAVTTLRNLLPTKRSCIMHYNASIDVGKTSNLTTQFIYLPFSGIHGFRPNSVYDPYTGALTTADRSSSLYGYFSRFYGRYSVKYCVATFRLVQRDTSSGGQLPELCFGVRLETDSTVPTNVTSTMAVIDKRWRLRKFRPYNSSGNDMSRGVAVVKHYWSEKMIELNDRGSNGAAPGYNPSATAPVTWFFYPALCTTVPGQTALSGVPTDNYVVTVHLKQFVEWSDPNDFDADTLIQDIDS